MQPKQTLRVAAALVTLAAAGLAHHVDVPLSTLFGPDVLDGVVFYTESGKFGVPNVRPGQEPFDHHHAFDVEEGDAFRVVTHSGAAETIVLGAADFGGSLADVQADELAAAINAKASLVEAFTSNGVIALRGVEGGSTSTLDLRDGPGAPLAMMTIPTGLGAGSDHLDLVLSVPEDHPVDLAGHAVWLLVSATEGSFELLGETIPLGPDALFAAGVQAAAKGALPGFVTTLDAQNDAAATAQGSWLAGFEPGDELYLAYVVLSADGSAIELVSNRFTVSFL